MGRHRMRKKRRRRFTKEKAVNTILAALVVVLVLAWAGLHWRDSQKKTSAAPSTGTAAAGENADIGKLLQLGEDTELPLPSGAAEAGVGSGGREPGQVGATGIEADLPGNLGETGSRSGEGAGAEGSNGIGAAGADRDGESGAAGAKGTTEATGAAGTNNPSSAAGAAGSGGEANTGNGSTAVTSATGAGTATTNTAARIKNHQQEIVKVQATCKEESARIMSGAETSFNSLNKQDLAALKKWNDRVHSELAAAESDCDAAFEKQIAQAEEDGIPEKSLTEWKQTYAAAKSEQKQETERQLAQIVRK